VLNFRSGDNLKVHGDIMINGSTADAKTMSIISCYIQQDDLFFGTLTVREHLEFHVSHLRDIRHGVAMGFFFHRQCYVWTKQFQKNKNDSEL
jgi:ABC-type multidrug transport system ATPase subunit